MIIDIIFFGFMALAVIKGFQKGLIIALFSIIAFIAGIAAALKLSALVSVWLSQSTNINVKWIPFISFILIFFIVVLIIRWSAKLIEKAVEFAFLGWLNKIGGIILFALLYTIILSVLLFFASQLHVFTEQTIKESKTYVYIQPWGPRVIDSLGTIIPLFKNVFAELQSFFEKIGGKLSV
jgi:membrane protein required for colicin V production